ncbi:MAG: hexokinase [Treponema sp.]|nr:hexokinase [Treponema sp.]
MYSLVDNFFVRHNFIRHINIEEVSHSIQFDMINGLHKKKADQDMICTFLNPPSSSVKNKNVIVIDAGGTNFRSCLVSFDKNGKSSISMQEKTSMPGVEKELSKKEFFDAIAKNIDYLKDKADTIGFCFSYPVQITKDGDGILKMFSKEIHAPEVVGCKIGEALSETLLNRGWKKVRVTLLNDTVAALLSGAVRGEDEKKYSSYIGLILGTGLNAAYIQPKNQNINLEEQIVVCESGKFNGIVCSSFDFALTAKTQHPKLSLLEKQCSGAYLASCAYEILQVAADEEIFSKDACREIKKMQNFSLKESDEFLSSPYTCKNMFSNICKISSDYDILYELLDAVMERSSRYTASVLIACALQCAKGFSASMPLCIVANGSTYYKTHKILKRVNAYLEEFLTVRHGIHWEIISVENDITLGTAIGAFASA